jgi:hypothetical protein
MMASAPLNGLPLFYNQLQPLSSVAHADFRTRRVERAPFLAQAHAIPVTVDEFALVQRTYPIVFSVGENPVPLALMGLNENVNTFVDDEGALVQDVYVPAYIRRYPFMLARLREGADELSLCFDPTSDAVGQFDEGDPLFSDGQISPTTQGVLEFCEQFEQAGQRTGAFMQELLEHKLLMDGEVSIQVESQPQPYIYRGFQMVSEDKLRELRGDVVRKMVQSGLLALIYAHLLSMNLVRDIFARQVAQGKMPPQEAPQLR